MAQLLHHQDSGLNGKETQGRRWSFLQFFGLRRRPRSMKMLTDKKHGQEKSTGGSMLRGCYVPLKDEDSGVTDDHKSTQDRNKHKGSKKNSGKTSLKSLISRKFYGKEGHKEKMLPVAPRLLRTLSIHYLESNVYVFEGESAPNGDGSSHGAKFSQQNATGTNLQHNTLDGSGSDASFSRLLSRGEEHVKRKSHRSISMDGILHKVPYGNKVSGDTIIEELPRSASATYYRDGLKPFTSRRHLNQGFQRSRSLSESLESYSHLLESISSREAKRALTSSKSTRDHSLDGPGVTTELQRSSSSQLRSKGLTRFAEYLVIPEDALASNAPDKIVLDGDVEFAADESSCNEVAGGCENTMLLEEYLSEEKRDAAASTEAGFCIAPISSEVVDISEEHSATACVDDQVLPSTEISLCTDPSRPKVDIPEEDEPTLLSLLQSEDIGITEQHEAPSDDEIQSCAAQPSEDTSVAEEHPMISNDNHIQSFEGTCCVPDLNQDSEDELNLGCEQETESPTSVLDVAFSDHEMLDDSSSLEENIVHSNEVDDSVGDVNDLNVQESNLSDLNDFSLQEADPKNEAVLNYVKDIFSKSSFTKETLFDTWRSQNIAALEDEGCQHNELSFSAAVESDLAIADMCADEFLLFDLTNEALLDMYRKYAARSRFTSRPKPVGQNALRELCSRVSCQLDDQQTWFGLDVDGLLSSDLAKADRWVEFRGDGDLVGEKVADLVLDRLVTELALQLIKF
uniref:Uncharacterized protein n=1 Tax=Avena sativa TaxID=4498 RepID=A0ACD5TSM1_AVESA